MYQHPHQFTLNLPLPLCLLFLQLLLPSIVLGPHIGNLIDILSAVVLKVKKYT